MTITSIRVIVWILESLISFYLAWLSLWLYHANHRSLVPVLINERGVDRYLPRLILSIAMQIHMHSFCCSLLVFISRQVPGIASENSIPGQWPECPNLSSRSKTSSSVSDQDTISGESDKYSELWNRERAVVAKEVEFDCVQEDNTQYKDIILSTVLSWETIGLDQQAKFHICFYPPEECVMARSENRFDHQQRFYEALCRNFTSIRLKKFYIYGTIHAFNCDMIKCWVYFSGWKLTPEGRFSEAKRKLSKFTFPPSYTLLVPLSPDEAGSTHGKKKR